MNKILKITAICVSIFAMGGAYAVSSDTQEKKFYGGVWQSRISKTDDGPAEFETKAMEFNSEGKFHSRYRAGEIEKDRFGNLWVKIHKDEAQHDQSKPPLKPHRLRDTDCDNPSFWETRRLRDNNCDSRPPYWKSRGAFESGRANRHGHRHMRVPRARFEQSAPRVTADADFQKALEHETLLQ